MTDPVSISFGVAGILGLAIQLSPIVASYVNGVRHAPENVQNLRQELDALIKTLERLDSFLKSESAKGPAFNDLPSSIRQESLAKRDLPLYQPSWGHRQRLADLARFCVASHGL